MLLSFKERRWLLCLMYDMSYESWNNTSSKWHTFSSNATCQGEQNFDSTSHYPNQHFTFSLYWHFLPLKEIFENLVQTIVIIICNSAKIKSRKPWTHDNSKKRKRLEGIRYYLLWSLCDFEGILLHICIREISKTVFKFKEILHYRAYNTSIFP